MSISMHIQNLDKFDKIVLKILSGNEKIMMDEQTNKRTDERNDRKPKSYIAPLFQSGGYKNGSILDPDVELKTCFYQLKYCNIST